MGFPFGFQDSHCTLEKLEKANSRQHLGFLNSQIYSVFLENPIPYLFCGKTVFGFCTVKINNFFKKLPRLDNISEI
jgi:hypothetical protein